MISYDIHLSLTDFTQDDNFQAHPCCSKWLSFIIFMPGILILPI